MTDRAARPPPGALRALAWLYDAQTAYYDVDGRRREASPEALLAVLGALGAPVASFGDVRGALRERRVALWRRALEPVIVAWFDREATFELRLPASMAEARAACRLALEDGEARTWQVDLAGAPVARTEELEGEAFVARMMTLPPGVVPGYHRLAVDVAGRTAEALVIAAPVRAYAQPGRGWGVLLPLYALRTERSWGAGDVTDLAALMEWAGGLGADVVATLPLLACFLDGPAASPSPYTPISRLFWNELYVDPAAAPEFERCLDARKALAAVEAERLALRDAPLVDYARTMAAKRSVLERAARCLGGERSRAFRDTVAAEPELAGYARFRAAYEAQGEPWHAWQERLRDGDLRPGDYDPAVADYYAYAQWLAGEQLAEVSRGAADRGQLMYLDLPIGVHPDGYDVWRHRSLFARGTSTGAPPDTFFAAGQDWGFPPLRPDALREDGYAYVVRYLRRHLQQARVLRIDHVMGLHRLFWLAPGSGPERGVYVRYPARELYAILSLESHRHRATIVGENLGTVPLYVNAAMTRHRLQQTYVVQFALRPPPAPLPPATRESVATLNTHDMPPFAAFLSGADIDQRLELGIIDDDGAAAEREARAPLRDAVARPAGGNATPREALRACLGAIGRSRARFAVANLEDCWLETAPQNVPGTIDTYPNWRRKAAHTLESFREQPDVLDALAALRADRRGAAS